MPAANPGRPDAALTDAALEAQFDAMVRREYPRLAELAWTVLDNRADAEEVVQDVLLAVWRHRTRFDFAHPVPYLVRAVRNRSLSRRRLHWRRAARLLTLAGERADTGGDEPHLGQDELLRALDAAVESLPPRCREVFVLHRVNGLSYAEIATSLGIAPKTVENLMGRTLARLRTALRGHVGLAVLIALAARVLAG